MTYKGRQPVVKLVKTIYHTGVSLTQKQMAKLEQRFDRLEALPKWFVQIAPLPSDI
jgi:hypothetical protein